MSSTVAPLRLVVLGVGDAVSERWYSTSLALVTAAGPWLLIDCPHPIRKILREAAESSGVPLPVEQLVGVALTHLHADHCSGLEGLGVYWKFVRQIDRKLPLFAGREVAETLRSRPEAEYFDIRTVRKLVPTTDGPFRLWAHPTEHGNLAAYAFRVEAEGRSLAHSGDTAFDPELIRWLLEADFVVHEIGSDEPDSAFHAPYAKLLALPEKDRHRLHVIHYTDRFDVDGSALVALRQGRVYDV